MQVEINFIVHSDGSVVIWGPMNRRFSIDFTKSNFLAVSDGTILELRPAPAGPGPGKPVRFKIEVGSKGRGEFRHQKHEGQVMPHVGVLRWKQKAMKSVWVLATDVESSRVEWAKT